VATNYELPSAVEKRTRFFDGQFLQDQDFVDEQSYHLDRQRRHNRLLHVSGIAEGLNVTAPGENRVRVSEGTAIDADGRQLVLAKSTPVELPGERFNNTNGIELYVSYQQSPEDRQSTEGSEDFTRWLERPLLQAVAPGATYEGDTPPVLLAKVDLDGAGRITVDESVRTYSGVRLPGAAADAPSLRTMPSGAVSLTGDLWISRGKLRLDTDQQLVFATGDGDMPTQLKIQLADGYGIGIDTVALVYAAQRRHSWRDHRGNERMILSTGETGGLGVFGTGQSTFAGRLRAPSITLWRSSSEPSGGKQLFLELYQDDDALTVPEVYPSIRFHHGRRYWHRIEAQRDGFHFKDGDLDSDAYTSITTGPLQAPSVQLRRSASESTGGKQLFLELYQDDTRPQATVPEVYPNIRFHHNNRFWHRIEAREDGFHFKDGNLDSDGYTSIFAGNVFTTGRFYLEPSANWGTDPHWGAADQRRYWYFRRADWHVNNLTEGNVTVVASNIPFPSDVRLKQDVEEIADALARVERLRGVHFEWNADGLAHLSRDIEATTTMGPDATPEEDEELWRELRDVRHAQLAGRNIGLLAQELVHTDANGFKSVDYGRLTAVLVQAVKEQQFLIRDLSARIATIEQGV
jgi:hypothetical protein